MTDAELWTPAATGSLPDLEGATSRTVLFLVEGKPYAGHYHANGWFYCAESRSPVSMAMGRSDARPILSYGELRGEPPGWPVATHWRYLRPE